MTNQGGNWALRDLGSTADDRALALKQFAGMTKAKFGYSVPLWPIIQKTTISSGKSYQFPFFGHSDAEEHTAGTTLGGRTDPPTEERIVPVDNKELVNWVRETTVDRFLAHYETRDNYSTQLASGIDRQLESRAMRMIALGARQAERTVEGSDQTFDSGVLIQRDAADIETAYPLSATGSKRVQEDMGKVQEAFEDRGVDEAPDGMFHIYLSPYLKRVLLMDKTLTSGDWDFARENALLRRQIVKVENFAVHSTRILPQLTKSDGKPTGGSGNVTSGENAYRGDFSNTAMVGLGTADSLGAVMFGGLDAQGPEWSQENRSWLMSAAIFLGLKWLRPEACAEVYVSTSAYTESGGVFSP